ncbi:MAG TPA: RHS repeat-associated core domain-containing protein [Terriglobia bacterium]|nr:RHS repeat-associated core domain-containing protein [Terriglobia bacterium]
MDVEKYLTLREKAETARRQSAPAACQWDAENRMLSVDSGSTATYKYNSLGQRVERFLTSGSYTFDYLFGVGGEELGLYSAGGATWFDQDVPMGRRMLVMYGSPSRFLHTNNLGTTTVTADQTGAELQDELFYPWGQAWTSTGQPYDRHFAGMQGFENPGLVYPTDFRKYNPALGRWMTPDPLAGDVTNPQSLNRYAYVLNNPVSNTDPQGLLTCPKSDDTGTVDTEEGRVCTEHVDTVDVVGYPDEEPVWTSPIPGLSDGPGPGSDGPGGSGVTISSAPPPKPKRPQKKPCDPLANNLQGTPAAGLDTLFDAFTRLTHPLEMIQLNGIMFVTGGVVAATGGAAVVITCGTPEPFEPLTCAAGVAGGVPTAAGGAFLVKQSVSFFKNYTLPAIKDWGCHE